MAAGKKFPARARPSAGRGTVPPLKGKHQLSPNPSEAEVRMDKVEKVKEAVQRGEYRVPASDVAAKILEEMRRK